ncbi:lysophospholipid acyltransferase family protein [Acinetobacter haemolyticus]|uniref:lysophospholipid acyltransferase family protein n=1 Tax=Acinetobacter haemolyticus TaxID=29430 RepID=UPI0009494050|nr:lysophospholipid acyltransferase family protein [Acinetobacter haemolyticus]APR69734.1 lipid A biosynthesis acyltransferase [Acinetobacter haemolyticus]MCU4387429.1 lysophospholipid acyltransferase family protein [Acinetobacter haemolyticus]NAS07839.1 lipid A biosynthesis acyltransferase [Acinetobacter haemolyticus]NCU23506.1 lipid A biosynthesis acyltransferase [Acinetobacter haemolyticus]SUU14877.1 lipid A biosynthesis lauroyl acyltransferase [Acinetobacter haemolyticus]
MAQSKSSNTSYRLIKFLSRQPIQLGRFFARMLAGFLTSFQLSKISKIISLNIQIAFPNMDQQQRQQLTQKAIQNELTSYFEFLSIWGSSNQKNIQRIQNVSGEQYLHEALAEKKGIVLIVPHFGTWEVMNAWLSQYTEMTILYKPVKNPDADRFVREARSREQAHLVPTDESGVRQIFKALKQGGTTAILPDHTPDHGGEMINYFDIPLASSSLSAKLIQKTKAKALLIYTMRNDQDGFDMYIEPIDPQIYQGSAEDGTLIIHQTLEQLIKRYPDHYHWSYKRFSANKELKRIYDIDENQALAKVAEVRHLTQQASIT